MLDCAFAIFPNVNLNCEVLFYRIFNIYFEYEGTRHLLILAYVSTQNDRGLFSFFVENINFKL